MVDNAAFGIDSFNPDSVQVGWGFRGASGELAG